MSKKYEFTGATKIWLGKTLHRIRATAKFGSVEIGDLGGWIEAEKNLSHHGDAQVCDNARVYDNAWVCDNAEISTQKHWLCVGPIGSGDDFVTFSRTKDRKIYVKCGRLCGDIDTFADKVHTPHDNNVHAKSYLAAIEMAKARIDLT